MKEYPMRLHITPFSTDLLPAILGPSLVNLAANISAHTIQTFPENNYGFIDLPTMEAEKLKKKVNGAILKGKKIKVEEARPHKRRRVEETQENTTQHDEPTKKPKSKKSKTENKERNTMLGHELSPDRKVKRGWTEAGPAKSKKNQKGDTVAAASKYSDKDELLFRTKLPLNRTEAVSKTEKAKRKRAKDDHIVHEFERSTKRPTFLRQNVGLGIQESLAYVEGQGWVNEAGETMEQESERVSRKREAARAAKLATRPVSNRSKPSHTSPPATSASSGSDSSSDADSDAQEARAEATDPITHNTDETSSSGSSTDSDPADLAESEEGESSSDSVEDPLESGEDDVHPLEALFKKPKKPTSQDVAKPSLEISTSFSFFGAQDAEDTEEEPTVPGTPFTSQDIRTRGLRSAAPTPDTAHPSRFNSYGSSGLPGDEEAQDDSDNSKQKERLGGSNKRSSLAKNAAASTSSKQSDFEKKFWENRGDNNRAWKQRRRVVLKEKRQRENKARRPRNW